MPPLATAAIIAIGTELLTPFRIDTNSLFLTAELNALGIDVINLSLGHPTLEPASTDPLVAAVERLQGDAPVRLRVVVDVDAVDVGLPLAPVQLVDVVLGGLVEVDRILVDERLGREEVDLPEDARPVWRRVDDHDVLLGGGPERDLGRREVLARPVPAPIARLAHVRLLGEEGEQVVRRRRPERLARLEGKLEGGRLQVGEEDVEVVRIEARLLQDLTWAQRRRFVPARAREWQ